MTPGLHLFARCAANMVRDESESARDAEGCGA
jgi:hypothetical protein